MPTSVLFLAAVVLGGSGNKVGVIVGAFLVSYIPNRFIELAGYKYLIFGVALIVLMAFRPQGLLGARQRQLAYGRQAYQRMVGRPEPVSADNPMTTERGGRHERPGENLDMGAYSRKDLKELLADPSIKEAYLGVA